MRAFRNSLKLYKFRGNPTDIDFEEKKEISWKKNRNFQCWATNMLTYLFQLERGIYVQNEIDSRNRKTERVIRIVYDLLSFLVRY